MTFRQQILKQLFNSGLFEAQAGAILEAYLKDDISKEMRARIDEDVDGYPDMVYTVVWMGVKAVTLRWIDANCPKHWARPMFT